jgi:hypothetical protein
VDGFLKGLRDLSYVEGEKITTAWRFAPKGASDAQFAALATELVRLSVDVLVTWGFAYLAGSQATGTIPIVRLRQFDFLVNIKAAEALGLTFPPDAAAQVTQWVQ